MVMIEDGELQAICEIICAETKRKWNASADEYNQWDSLGEDERNELFSVMIQDLIDTLSTLECDTVRKARAALKECES